MGLEWVSLILMQHQIFRSQTQHWQSMDLDTPGYLIHTELILGAILPGTLVIVRLYVVSYRRRSGNPKLLVNIVTIRLRMALILVGTVLDLTLTVVNTKV